MTNQVLSTVRDKVQPQKQLPFRLREPFLSTPEAELFRALERMTGVLDDGDYGRNLKELSAFI